MTWAPAPCKKRRGTAADHGRVRHAQGPGAPPAPTALARKLALLARGREFEPFDRSLDVQISRLRKLIEDDAAAPRYIQTVWGVGYVFVPDGTS